MKGIQSKHDQIYDYLLAAVKRGEIGGLLPTEAEAADHLQVSRMSVSKAMSALKSQGYIARKQGRGSTILKQPGEEIPGIISVLPGGPYEMGPYFTSLMQVIASECIAKGYLNVFTGCPTAKAAASFDYGAMNSLAASGRYLGAIVLDTKIKHPQEWAANFKHPSFPVVWLAMTPGYFNGMINSVDIDNRAAAMELVGHLHAKGRRRIGYISCQMGTTHLLERFEGYKQALAQLDLKFNEEDVFFEEDEFISECGYKIARRLAGLRNPPDAYLIADCGLCSGMKRFAAECGSNDFFRQPVATFDYNFTGEIENAIVSVRQPFKQMAKEAFDLLLRIHDGKERQPAVKVLKAELITRQA